MAFISGFLKRRRNHRLLPRNNLKEHAAVRSQRHRYFRRKTLRSLDLSQPELGRWRMSIEAALFGMLGKDAETKTSAAGKPYLRLNIRTGDGDLRRNGSTPCVSTPRPSRRRSDCTRAARLHRGHHQA